MAPDLPALYGARPICKDFLKGDLLTHILIFRIAKNLIHHVFSQFFSGFLPPHIRDQAITKGVAPDLPALYGARPICKDFLKGDLLTHILIFRIAKNLIHHVFSQFFSGFLPPHIRDQAITKGVAPDLPALYGARPICKDFLKGDCRRSRNCRFRHLSPRQYDMEMSNCYTEYDDGYGAYDG